MLSTTLWGFLQSLWKKTWENFQLFESFSVNLTTFQNQPQCVLAWSARGEHVGLVRALCSSLLTNWDIGSTMGSMGWDWHHPESSGHCLLTGLLKKLKIKKSWKEITELFKNSPTQQCESNGEKPLPQLPLWPCHSVFPENSLWACAQPTHCIKLWAETLRLADEAPSLSVAVVWRLSTSLLHLAWPLFSPHSFI